MSLGKQLKKKRVDLDKTQREMSEILGITTIQYNKLENDRSTPSYKFLQRFADKFRVIIHIYPNL